MPATLKKLTSKTNQLTVLADPEDPDSTITFSYKTKAHTARMMRSLRDVSDEDGALRAFIAVVTKWDFAPDAGQPPIPLTEEGLVDVPMELMTIILEAITDDQSPKEATMS